MRSDERQVAYLPPLHGVPLADGVDLSLRVQLLKAVNQCDARRPA